MESFCVGFYIYYFERRETGSEVALGSALEIAMDANASLDTEEVENVYWNVFGEPQPYNYEPARDPRDQEQIRVRRNNGHGRETELWCEENEWRAR